MSLFVKGRHFPYILPIITYNTAHLGKILEECRPLLILPLSHASLVPKEACFSRACTLAASASAGLSSGWTAQSMLSSSDFLFKCWR